METVMEMDRWYSQQQQQRPKQPPRALLATEHAAPVARAIDARFGGRVHDPVHRPAAMEAAATRQRHHHLLLPLHAAAVQNVSAGWCASLVAAFQTAVPDLTVAADRVVQPQQRPPPSPQLRKIQLTTGSIDGTIDAMSDGAKTNGTTIAGMTTGMFRAEILAILSTSLASP
jgi:hypothetical protein